jgi:hypothetical protein
MSAVINQGAILNSRYNLPAKAVICFALAAFASGCGESTLPTENPDGSLTQTAPLVPPGTSEPSPQGTVAVTFPALTKPGRIYGETGAPYAWLNAYHGGTLVSRYVLYDDGTFALQFASTRYGFFQYPGQYSTSGSQVRLTWEGWSSAGPWESNVSLDADTLTVKYDLVMALSDFTDGVYVLSSAG